MLISSDLFVTFILVVPKLYKICSIGNEIGCIKYSLSCQILLICNIYSIFKWNSHRLSVIDYKSGHSNVKTTNSIHPVRGCYDGKEESSGVF